jgi:hypothetical protein
MPVTLIIGNDSNGVSVTNQDAPDIIISSATAPGPQGPAGVDGTNGVDANWVAYTQEEYDALQSPDPATLYVIVPA